MSQRHSEYKRVKRDRYQTPAWVTAALIPHLPRGIHVVWEPAAGEGKMVKALRKFGKFDVSRSDLNTGHDFLKSKRAGFDAIITNPPYSHAKQFIEHALSLMEPRGAVAMLLRTDYDEADTRQYLFRDCPQFHKKVVLTKRIIWFEKKAAPSENHAWYIWDHQHQGPATITYGPIKELK